MQEPRKFDEGIRRMLERYSPERIGYVLIDKTNNRNTSFQSTIKRSLELFHNLRIPSEREFHYTPPGSVGSKRKARQEISPVIIDSSFGYLIVDDVLESGGTLSSAIEMLLEQGLKSNQVFFCAGAILSRNKTPPLGVLVDEVSLFRPYFDQEAGRMQQVCSNYFACLR